MSTPILPFAVWASGTNQNSIPANDNSLRSEILNGLVISASTTAQPDSPATGDIYIIPTAATGAVWSTLTVGDLVIYSAGTWYAFAPVEGIVVNVAGTLKRWNGTAYVDAAAAGAGRSASSALATSGSVAIDYDLGDYFTLALAGNVSTFTFSNLPGSGNGATLMVRITQDSTPRTVGWPASFKWAGGVAAAVSTGSGAVDVLAITTFDNGTSWQATLAKAFA
jgi:hypothetical protein